MVAASNSPGCPFLVRAILRDDERVLILPFVILRIRTGVALSLPSPRPPTGN
jgi:hypothetical protein